VDADSGGGARHVTPRRLCALAALLLALATALGALAAHRLNGRLSADQAAVLQTAVQYQFFNALGLLALGGLIERWPRRTLRAAGALLTVGVVLFSGSLYLLLTGAPAIVGVLTPLGGIALILGWLLAAVALWTEPK
jgi:uncharacterized membrane protein YgdD (TMEM256/DUF423 family)